jgi:predicted transcriptional regulator
MALELNTYGDLKKVIKAIALKQKGEKIGNIALGTLMGFIPGAEAAKTTFEFIRAAISKPDSKKTSTWLDKLDIDDSMSAIVDDTVENGFMQMMSKTIESKPDDQPLEQNFNMNAEMVNYLKSTYKGRTVAGISEDQKATLKSAIKAYAREIMSEENATGSGASFNAGSGENYATPFAFGGKKKKSENRAIKFMKSMGWKVADLTLPKHSKMFDYKKIFEMKLNDMIEAGILSEVSYGKFKKEVTHRTKSEQLHKAIREVKRKLAEIDRIVEYTSRMKQELSEDEGGISYWKATQKNVSQISEMVNHLNNKIKNLNQ